MDASVVFPPPCECLVYPDAVAVRCLASSKCLVIRYAAAASHGTREAGGHGETASPAPAAARRRERAQGADEGIPTTTAAADSASGGGGVAAPAGGGKGHAAELPGKAAAAAGAGAAATACFRATVSNFCTSPQSGGAVSRARPPEGAAAAAAPAWLACTAVSDSATTAATAAGTCSADGAAMPCCPERLSSSAFVQQQQQQRTMQLRAGEQHQHAQSQQEKTVQEEVKEQQQQHQPHQYYEEQQQQRVPCYGVFGVTQLFNSVYVICVERCRLVGFLGAAPVLQVSAFHLIQVPHPAAAASPSYSAPAAASSSSAAAASSAAVAPVGAAAAAGRGRGGSNPGWRTRLLRRRRLLQWSGDFLVGAAVAVSSSAAAALAVAAAPAVPPAVKHAAAAAAAKDAAVPLTSLSSSEGSRPGACAAVAAAAENSAAAAAGGGPQASRATPPSPPAPPPARAAAGLPAAAATPESPAAAAAALSAAKASAPLPAVPAAAATLATPLARAEPAAQQSAAAAAAREDAAPKAAAATAEARALGTAEEWLRLLCDGLCEGAFYFSPILDLSQSLQRQLTRLRPSTSSSSDDTEGTNGSSSSSVRVDHWSDRFCCNRYFMEPLLRQTPEAQAFSLRVIQGFVGMGLLSYSLDACHTLCVISRRDVSRAGARFHSRGLNAAGDVSNMVETEQVLLVHTLRGAAAPAPLFQPPTSLLSRLPRPPPPPPPPASSQPQQRKEEEEEQQQETQVPAPPQPQSPACHQQKQQHCAATHQQQSAGGEPHHQQQQQQRVCSSDTPDEKRQQRTWGEQPRPLDVAGLRSAAMRLRPQNLERVDIYSFVQLRGSIPLLWRQTPTLKWSPSPMVVGNWQDSLAPAKKHFDALTENYGNVTAVNLVNKNGSEAVLGSSYEKVLQEQGRQESYVWFDFHQHCGEGAWQNLGLLIEKVRKQLQRQHYFHAVCTQPLPAAAAAVAAAVAPGSPWTAAAHAGLLPSLVWRRRPGSSAASCLWHGGFPGWQLTELPYLRRSADLCGSSTPLYGRRIVGDQVRVAERGEAVQLFGHATPPMEGVNAFSSMNVRRLQTGVFRVNCIDCLDRTNVVESLFAKHVLSRILVSRCIKSAFFPLLFLQEEEEQQQLKKQWQRQSQEGESLQQLEQRQQCLAERLPSPALCSSNSSTPVAARALLESSTEDARLRHVLERQQQQQQLEQEYAGFSSVASRPSTAADGASVAAPDAAAAIPSGAASAAVGDAPAGRAAPAVSATTAAAGGSSSFNTLGPLPCTPTEGEIMFRSLWTDNADAISLLYSGTKALKTDFTRTGVRSSRGVLNDTWNSINRYFLNNFFDGYKQDYLTFFFSEAAPCYPAPVLLSRAAPEAVAAGLFFPVPRFLQSRRRKEGAAPTPFSAGLRRVLIEGVLLLLLVACALLIAPPLFRAGYTTGYTITASGLSLLFLPLIHISQPFLLAHDVFFPFSVFPFYSTTGTNNSGSTSLREWPTVFEIVKILGGILFVVWLAITCVAAYVFLRAAAAVSLPQLELLAPPTPADELAPYTPQVLLSKVAEKGKNFPSETEERSTVEREEGKDRANKKSVRRQDLSGQAQAR